MKSTFVRSADAEERWLLYDASEQNLGRMASEIAMSLMGKDRPSYTPSQLTGAFVVVTNSAKSKLSGSKDDSKLYVHYTKYHDGQKKVALSRVRTDRPNDIVKLAVRRMLPKTKLGHDMLRRLKVYEGADHPHSAQQPTKITPAV
ncbi:MAG TPA: 50S ribosomal protein L13 [Planctomycetota bacterium]|nr:50S ribosomal protein L13 [Planctomycetota bacterium]